MSNFLTRTEPIPCCNISIWHIFVFVHGQLSQIERNLLIFIHLSTLFIDLRYTSPIIFDLVLHSVQFCPFPCAATSPLYPHSQMGQGPDLGGNKSFLLVKVILSRGRSHVSIPQRASQWPKRWAELGVSSAFSSSAVLEELQLLPDLGKQLLGYVTLGVTQGIRHPYTMLTPSEDIFRAVEQSYIQIW